MRATLAFLAAIFGTLLLAALLAYPVWLVVHALVPEWAFNRVAGRFWQLLLLIGLLFALRRLGLRGRQDWGWGLPRPEFLRQAGAGLAIGVATMLPMTIAMFALGVTVLVWLLFATRFGVAITAVHDDERVADLMGLDEIGRAHV